MSRRRRHRPSPEPVTARVTGLSHEGRGITHVDGKTVFVNETLPDEEVTFQYVRRFSRYDEARPLEIAKPSSDRIKPGCDAYDLCGGCSLQHVSPGYQLQHKQKALEEQFSHIGGVQPETWLRPLTGPVWRYRRRARLAVKYVEKKDRLLVGFREKYSPFVADIDRCEVLSFPVGHMLVDLQRLITVLSGYKHIPQIEVAVADNATALVLRHLRELTESDRHRLLEFEDKHNVIFYLQPDGLESVKLLRPDRSVRLYYKLVPESLYFYFEPTDFIQINAEINQAMIRQAVDLLDLNDSLEVLDLFCGLGNFSLPIAKRAAKVTAIEGDRALITRAKLNAIENHITNVEFYVSDLFGEHINGNFLNNSYERIFLDPPRTGAEDIIRQLDLSKTERLVYVSCNPATLARDAGILVHENGFRLLKAGVMDMFPHTAHIESIALFVHNTSDA